MAIIINGKSIPTNGDNIIVNGVKVTKVIANGVVVWEKMVEEQKNVSNTYVEKDNASLSPIGFSELLGEIGNGSVYQSVTVTVTSARGEEWHENQWFDLGIGIIDDSNRVRNCVSLGRVSPNSPVSASGTVTITIPNENRIFYLCGGSVAWSGSGMGYFKVQISNPVKLTRR